MSNHTYIKYLTEQFVTYINKTPQERKIKKEMRQTEHIYSNRWFGLIPFTFKMIFRRGS